ncbi:MAG: glycogen/starch/alpha-glucan phosphorylase, partial [Erysipelotrichaceae bacterium]|nr:glycogen/starch/alpha-glucan phosphorylase [Erysipelotrichaceae bacterium]
VMKDFYYLYPEKFNSKTNGITHRRWLLYSNPQLTQLLTDKIGPGFINDPQQLEKLLDYVDDEDTINRFMEVKKQRKQILANYIKKKLDIDIDINSIFDVQAKRLHAYKRQMLNCMNIIALYQRFKKEPGFTIYPRTFIFAAKAAPSYVYAKNVIELINRLAAVINNDPEVSRYMKVVFIPNYNVSIAEILMNAADISEQISTAGKEASGTGNMKLMMNGAITLGTLDGTNVEIAELVGDDNIIVFGHNVDELRSLKYNGYDAMELYRTNETIHAVLDSLVDGTWHPNKDEFKPIFDEILYRNDEYFLLADFEQYSEAQRTVYHLYKEHKKFCRMCLINIAKSGYFSSDRTISDYNRDIWHLKEIR